jgi:hypothetical protein
MSFTELPHSFRVNTEGINTGITIISSWFSAYVFVYLLSCELRDVALKPEGRCPPILGCVELFDVFVDRDCPSLLKGRKKSGRNAGSFFESQFRTVSNGI